VFAEVDPNQKERIIRALQRTGRVVGYMGDGINDAPALHTADVGISVDQAVDVAREAADFVLLRRDLAVLHQGIVEGRSTFANTLKYVFMATSANFGNMFSMAGASLLLPFLPLLPKQVLLVNLLTDLPEMTIATDNVDPEFVARPHHGEMRFIRRFMFVFGPLSSVFDFLTFGALLVVLGATPAQFRAGWFVESVLSAALVVFVLRTRQPVLRSRPSRSMVAVTAVVIGVTLLLPRSGLAGLLEFQAPAPAYLLLILTIVAAYLGSAELAKRLFYRLYPPEESSGAAAR
jgi:Mg2+-importing ATPase